YSLASHSYKRAPMMSRNPPNNCTTATPESDVSPPSNDAKPIAPSAARTKPTICVMRAMRIDFFIMTPSMSGSIVLLLSVSVIHDGAEILQLVVTVGHVHLSNRRHISRHRRPYSVRQGARGKISRGPTRHLHSHSIHARIAVQGVDGCRADTLIHD